MPDYSRKSDLQAAVTRALGQRSGSEALKVVAYWKETDTFWALKQDGFLNDQEMASLREELGTARVYQAWLSTCDIDWTASTGLRARMVGVSAHLNQMTRSAEWRDLSAAANCACTVECMLEMERLPAEEPVVDAGAVHSAWWTFMSDIPFEQFDLPIQNGRSLVGLTQGRPIFSA